jgi:hypothetical protein
VKIVSLAVRVLMNASLALFQKVTSIVLILKSAPIAEHARMHVLRMLSILHNTGQAFSQKEKE